LGVPESDEKKRDIEEKGSDMIEVVEKTEEKHNTRFAREVVFGILRAGTST